VVGVQCSGRSGTGNGWGESASYSQYFLRKNECACLDPLVPFGKVMEEGWNRAFEWNKNLVGNVTDEEKDVLHVPHDSTNRYGNDDYTRRMYSYSKYMSSYTKKTQSNEDSKVTSNSYNYPLETTTTITSTTSSSTIEKEPYDVVFLGDSITEQWNGHQYGLGKSKLKGVKSAFDKLFRKENGAEVDGLALGIAGDTCANLLYRIQNGEVPDSLNANVFWVLIGTNDLGYTDCSEEIVLIGILRIVQELLQRKPTSTIVINGILPRTNRKDGYLEDPPESSNDTNDDDIASSIKRSEALAAAANANSLWPSIVNINKGLEMYAERTDRVEYFDASELFLAQLGNSNYRRKDKILMKELMNDYLHPSATGAELWGKEIVQYLTEHDDIPEGLHG